MLSAPWDWPRDLELTLVYKSKVLIVKSPLHTSLRLTLATFVSALMLSSELGLIGVTHFLNTATFRSSP